MHLKRKWWEFFLILPFSVIPVLFGIYSDISAGYQPNYLAMAAYILLEICVVSFFWLNGATWKAKRWKIFLLVFILVIADQGLKLVVFNLNPKLPIIPNVLKIVISKNIFHNAFFSAFQIAASRWTGLAIKLLTGLFFGLLVFLWGKKNNLKVMFHVLWFF